MFLRWGHFVYRLRYVVPAIIAALILGIYGIFGLQLNDRLSQEGWDDPHSSSTRAAQIEQEVFGRDASGDVVLLVHAPEGSTADDPAFGEQVQGHLDALAAQYPEQILRTTSYWNTGRQAAMLSEDREIALATISLQGIEDEVLRNYRVIEDDIPLSGVEIDLAGQTVIADALDEGMANDLSRAESLGLPAVAILLFLVFGGLVAAGIPLIVGIMTILGSMGILSLLAASTQVNSFAQPVITLLGLGLAIDYGLFMVSRFREELAEGYDVRDATARTTATAGRTVVFSALMVAVSLSGLLLFPQAFLKSVAYGAMSAVGLAALLSVTLVPPLLGILGHRIDALGLRSLRREKTAAEVNRGFWGKVPAWAMKRPVITTAVITAAMLALILPMSSITFGGINEKYLPPANPTRVAQESFDATFPEFRTDPIKLVVQTDDPANLATIYTQANEVDGLSSRFSATTPTTDGTTVLSAGLAERDNAAEVVAALRAIDTPEGTEVFIGGTPALETESIEALFATLPWMGLYVIVATFILMAVTFGSFVLPLKAIIMTLVTLGSTLGVLTWMFIDGNLSGLLNFSPGPLMSPVLVLIVAIIYGLSTDYEVFLVSRMVEARDRGQSTDQAIRWGTAQTGRIITAAALIMIVVAAAFAFSEIVMMKYIAFGLIVSLLLDATIVRMLLVPAVMKLLKEDNWWAPRWLTTLQRTLKLHATEIGDDRPARQLVPAGGRPAPFDPQPVAMAAAPAAAQRQTPAPVLDADDEEYYGAEAEFSAPYATDRLEDSTGVEAPAQADEPFVPQVPATDAVADIPAETIDGAVDPTPTGGFAWSEYHEPAYHDDHLIAGALDSGDDEFVPASAERTEDTFAELPVDESSEQPVVQPSDSGTDTPVAETDTPVADEDTDSPAVPFIPGNLSREQSAPRRSMSVDELLARRHRD